MRKYVFFIGLLLVINIVAIWLVPRWIPLHKPRTVHLAVVGPMTGKDLDHGTAMRNGIDLCLKDIRAQGRLPGVEIQPVYFDDRNDRRSALNVATRLAGNRDILLVLGHYYKNNCGVAGTIYNKNGIPAITAAAVADTAFSNNDWYFRVRSSNQFESRFIAEYIKQGLGRRAASIVHDTGLYSDSLMQSFEAGAREQGIEIKQKWSFDRDDRHLYRRLKRIAAGIRATADPGVIYFATNIPEGVDILKDLSFPGTPYTVIGPASFSTPSFRHTMRAHAVSESMAGYGTAGIHAVMPFMMEIAGARAHGFKRRYMETYNEVPSPVAAAYYDAMLVAVNAIEKGEISGRDIREDRRRIRDSLNGFNAVKSAVQGVTGTLYFDTEGNVRKPPAMGVYRQGRLLPAHLQFQYGADPARSHEGIPLNDAAGKAPDDRSGMIQTRVVYTGLHMLGVSGLDMGAGRFTASFILRFRYRGDFDPLDVRFINAVTPIRLQKPVWTGNADGDTIRAYRVTAAFITGASLQADPFDAQTLGISLRHETASRKRLIFVYDERPLPGQVALKHGLDEMVNLLDGRHVRRISQENDVVGYSEKTGTLPGEFSRFTAAIHLDKPPALDALKVILPPVLLVLMLAVVSVMPGDRAGNRLLLWTAVLLINTGYVLFNPPPFSGGIPGSLHLSVYALAAVAALETLLSYRQHRLGRAARIRFGALGVHAAALVIMALWVFYRYIT